MDEFKKWFESDFEDDTNELFKNLNGFVRYQKFNTEPVWNPAMDIFESEDEIIIILEIAGVKKEDVDINYEDSILKISGKRVNNELEKISRINQLEIEYGRFERLVKLGKRVDVDSIKVVFNNGMLKIMLPLKSVVKKIPITPE